MTCMTCMVHLLNKEQNDEVSDTTMLPRKTEAGNKIKFFTKNDV